MRRLKILWIATPLTARYGVIGTLAGRAGKIDCDQFDITLAFSSPDPEEVRKRFMVAPRLKLLHLAELSSLNRLYIPAVRSLVSHMREERYDIAHTIFVQSDILGSLAARIAGLPVVLSSVMGYLVVPVGAVRLKTLLYKLAYRLALTNIHRVLPITRATGRQLVHEFGVPAEKIEVLYSGVELQQYPKPVRNDGSFVIGSAGQLIPQKGVDTIIAALPRLTKKIPGVRLVVAGDGPERPRLEQLARELGVDDRTQFLGFKENMPELMATFDVFVFGAFPGYDGLPRVILEAMIQRTPVVAARTEPIEEVVVDGSTGWSYQPGNSTELAAVVARVHENGAEVERFVSAAFGLAREISESEVKHLENIYKTSMETFGRKSRI